MGSNLCSRIIALMFRLLLDVVKRKHLLVWMTGASFCIMAMRKFYQRHFCEIEFWMGVIR